jgi:phosphatidylinositol alpha-1,6-mannosyltransferase
LVTNDFPPKVGGIQVYLWELWKRLDPGSFSVLTASSNPQAGLFDAQQAENGVRIERIPESVLLPTHAVVRRVREMASRVGASLVVIDPVLPLGIIGPKLGIPYAVVLHGAEVTVPGRLPLAKNALASVLSGARLAICAGNYPMEEARRAAGDRMPATVIVPPGVDVERFQPIDADRRAEVRRSLGIEQGATVVVSISRLVPRKGMDVLIDAAAALKGGFPELTVLIGGQGRDEGRLRRRIEASRSPVRLLGHVSDKDLPDIVAAADVFVMACRNRWAGLEQEGFGIVFLEAAAAGIPQIAGSSGGAAEAVVEGETGLVVFDPSSASQLAAALRRILSDETLRRRMGAAARKRAEESFSYDLLARRLSDAVSVAEQDLPGTKA